VPIWEVRLEVVLGEADYISSGLTMSDRPQLEYLTLCEIGALAGLSEGTIRRYIAQGEFPEARHTFKGKRVWHQNLVRRYLLRWRQPTAIPSTAESRS
jgi:predicted DNA-binding transcriptional regulator AlpA